MNDWRDLLGTELGLRHASVCGGSVCGVCCEVLGFSKSMHDANCGLDICTWPQDWCGAAVLHYISMSCKLH